MAIELFGLELLVLDLVLVLEHFLLESEALEVELPHLLHPEQIFHSVGGFYGRLRVLALDDVVLLEELEGGDSFGVKLLPLVGVVLRWASGFGCGHLNDERVFWK